MEGTEAEVPAAEAGMEVEGRRRRRRPAPPHRSTSARAAARAARGSAGTVRTAAAHEAGADAPRRRAGRWIFYSEGWTGDRVKVGIAMLEKMIEKRKAAGTSRLRLDGDVRRCACERGGLER